MLDIFYFFQFFFFQNGLGETQLIWMNKIGMIISNKGETNVKVVWFPLQLIYDKDKLLSGIGVEIINNA